MSPSCIDGLDRAGDGHTVYMDVKRRHEDAQPANRPAFKLLFGKLDDQVHRRAKQLRWVRQERSARGREKN